MKDNLVAADHESGQLPIHHQQQHHQQQQHQYQQEHQQDQQQMQHQQHSEQEQEQQHHQHQQQKQESYFESDNDANSSNSSDRAIPTLPPMTLLGGRNRNHDDHPDVHGDAIDNFSPKNQNSSRSSISWFRYYLSECVWPGMGLFGESYLLFSIGTLRPMWELIYPHCLLQQQNDNNEREGGCSKNLIHSLTYSVVLGIITGMILIGYLANKIGRRKGSILTASLMAFGSLGLTFVSCFFVNSPQFLFTCMSCLLFLFGIGVGGEYPLSASSASERAMGDNIQRRKQLQYHEQQQSPSYQFQRQRSKSTQTQTQAEDDDNVYYSMNPDSNAFHQDDMNNNYPKKQLHQLRAPQQENRGKHIQLVFTMQGAGIFFNSVTMTALLIIMGQGQIVINHDNNDKNNRDNNFDDQSSSLLDIWRITYALGAVILSYVLVSRIQHLTESQVWEDDKLRRDHQQSKRSKEALYNANNSVTEIMKHYSTVGNHDNGNCISPTSLSTPIPVIPTVSSVSSLSAPSVVVHSSLPDSPSEMQITTTRTSTQQKEQYQHTPQTPQEQQQEQQQQISALSESNVIQNDNNHQSDYNKNHHDNNHHQQYRNPNLRCAEECEYYHVLHLIKQVPSTDPLDDLKSSPTSLLLRNYGLRLFGASLSWLLWDISFYGNKLFQSSFILALTGEETTLLEFALAATLNAFIALLGYFVAAILIDMPSIGRRNLQQFGFLITGSLFVTCGFTYSSLSSGWLIFFYLGSSFFGQCGPNATTFLIPAEIFPTEMRTFCHGICAASGKLGALFASIIFNYMVVSSSSDGDDDNNDIDSSSDGQLDMFLLSGYASFAACAITFWTIPETAGLDLFELDRKWRMILDGKKGDYIGPANHPKFLSYYERIKLGLQH